MRRLALFLTALTAIAFAQVDTGIPNFATFGGGGFDKINLGNNNVHLSIPVYSKPGRGMGFSFSLEYDSSVWVPVVSGANKVWTPTGNWGWTGATQAKAGYFKRAAFSDTCWYAPKMMELNISGVTYYAYVDEFGTEHPINVDTYTDTCTHVTYGDTASSNDGSGLTYTLATTMTGTSSALYPNGMVRVGSDSNAANATATDSNGNRINVAYSSGTYTYTDTLGSTALTVSGSATPASPKVYTYTDSSGTSRTVTVNYTNYSLRTNFGCGAGYTEYGTSGSVTANLVSSISLPNGTSYTFTYEVTPGFSTFKTGRLASVTLPTGGTISYTYSGGSNGIVCADGSTATLNRTTADSANATNYTRSNVSGSQWTTNVHDPIGNESLYTFQKVQSRNSFVEVKRESYSGTVASGTLMFSKVTCYGSTNCASGYSTSATVSYPVAFSAYHNILDNGRHSGASINYDSVGAVTDVYDYDWGATTGGAVGSLLRRTNTTYTNPGNGLHLPSVVTIYDGAATQQAKTTYAYDAGSLTSTTATQHVGVSGARGNLTSVTTWSNGAYASDPVSSYTYYDTGMVRTITDPEGHVTTFDYTDNFSDATNHNAVAFVKTVTNAASQVVSTNKYHWPSAVQTESKDVNNQTTTFTYDSMLRPLVASYPDGGSVTNSYDDTNKWVQVETLLATGVVKTSYAKYDSYGRVNRTGTYNGSTDDLVDTCFNQLGQVSFNSAPFQDILTASQHCSNDGTATTYDALGRVSTVTAKATSLADRVTTYTYRGQSAQVEDAGNGTTTLKKVSQSDALGRTLWVCEVSATTQQGSNNTPSACGSDLSSDPSGFKTVYSYDTLGHLTQVSQTGLKNRYYQYDTLGRVTRVAIPEEGTSTDNTGPTTFTYNKDNLTLTRERPAPNQTSPTTTVITTYSYDSIHRPTQTSYNDSATPTVNISYDSAPTGWSGLTNITGRPTKITNGSGYGTSVFSYDSIGRVVDGWYCTPATGTCDSSGSRHMVYAYNKAGEMTSFNNSQWTMTYAYDLMARLTTATSGWSDSTHPATMYSTGSTSFGIWGINNYTVGASIGSGVKTTVSYNNFGEVTSKSAVNSGGSGTTVFSMGSMSYAPNGMLTASTVNSSAWQFTYDDLGRILTSQNGASNPFNYDYDRYGNRAHQSQTGGGPNPTTPSDGVTNRIASGNGVTYDALGNIRTEVIGITTRTYTYDAENRLTSVSGDVTASYKYDAASLRVQKTTGGTSLDYYYDPSGNVTAVYNGSTFTRGEVFLGAKHVATYVNSHTYFHFKNWIGSESTRTDESGTKVQDCEWYAFGELKACTTNTNAFAYTPYGYAGYERDEETGLDHMQFRYYNPRIGRFLGADLLTGENKSPQSLNRFAYSLNSPASFTDPSGLCPNYDLPGHCRWSGGVTDFAAQSVMHAESLGLGNPLDRADAYRELASSGYDFRTDSFEVVEVTRTYDWGSVTQEFTNVSRPNLAKAYLSGSGLFQYIANGENGMTSSGPYKEGWRFNFDPKFAKEVTNILNNTKVFASGNLYREHSTDLNCADQCRDYRSLPNTLGPYSLQVVLNRANFSAYADVDRYNAYTQFWGHAGEVVGNWLKSLFH